MVLVGGVGLWPEHGAEVVAGGIVHILARTELLGSVLTGGSVAAGGGEGGAAASAFAVVTLDRPSPWRPCCLDGIAGAGRVLLVGVRLGRRGLEARRPHGLRPIVEHRDAHAGGEHEFRHVERIGERMLAQAGVGRRRSDCGRHRSVALCNRPRSSRAASWPPAEPCPRANRSSSFAIGQLSVAGGSITTFGSLPTERSSTGAGVPQMPSLIGGSSS